MKIAITSQNRREITGHAGRCRNFWIYEIAEEAPQAVKDKQLLELPKEQSLHEHAGNGPHPLDGVDVLITGGMGGGMRQRLAGKGIRGITTPETDPDRAVADLLDGSLVEQASDHDCKCDHGHAHHHERGRSVFPRVELA